MRRLASILVPSAGAALFAVAAASLAWAQPYGCCGQGMMGQGMMGQGMMGPGMMGNTARHHWVMMNGLPGDYASLSNPLPNSPSTVDRGAAAYAQNCAACHGSTGQGDGDAGRALSPPPANLALISQAPMGRWDGFLYWAIAEGGQKFGTAMPAFKGSLSKAQIWSLVRYIQAGLPQRRGPSAASRTK